ncbi:Blue light- and temperature-regulated antirepressor BluF [Methylobacterium brachiatum]|nr:Blue light- and temperature-regulated antirepressor BluF [Methylobacterium brachiatum]
MRGCKGCRDEGVLPIAFTMAFQPIIDFRDRTVWGYEALVRGLHGESAAEVLSDNGGPNRYTFDQACRVKAIELGGSLFPKDGTRLSINFLPDAVYEPTACIRATLDAAHRVGFDRRRIVFEFTEDERMHDVAHLRRIVDVYRRQGFATALDDFGAGYAGLNLLAEFQPDYLKIDMGLIRGIGEAPVRQAIVESVLTLAQRLGVAVIAEGVETVAELRTLRDLGIALFQGYLFARPAVAVLPPVSYPSVDTGTEGEMIAARAA